MNDRRPAPEELRKLVLTSLPPRTTVELDWWDFDFREWRFRLEWFGERFVLRIPGDHWADQLTELISLCAAFGAPRPDATVGGRKLSLCLERLVPGDSTRYRFSIFRRPGEEPRSSTVVVTGSAGGMLAARSGGHEERTFELALALWLLKDLVDRDAIGEEFVVHGSNVESLLKRDPVSDGEIRRYAGLKIHQTYQMATKVTPLSFGWLDFGYLGISEEDFSRAVSLRDGKDWSVSGLSITPTADLLERLDTESSAERREFPERSSPRKGETKDLFLSYASEDKDTLVRPLAEGLTGTGMSVWFDEYELVLGDSLREKIDEGLRNSRHGLVVLSHSFFKKEWPKKELDGLFSLMDRDRRIMPIWHGLQTEDIRGYSPILAGILGIKSSEGIDKIVNAVTKAIGRERV